jgi:hypothetical protein
VLLSAGPLITLSLGGAVFNFLHDDFGGYGQFIQGRSPLDLSGTGTLSNGGRGADIPAFSLTLDTAPLANFQWNEQASLASFTAGQPLTVSWSGSDASGYVDVIAGTGTPIGISIQCRALGSENRFTIPADVTRLMPAGPAQLAVNFSRPGGVSGRPAALDWFRYERRIVRSRQVTVQ